MLRRQRGLSQARLAGDDFDPSYISLIEAGRRAPTDAVLSTLAERLGCSVPYLLSGVDAPSTREVELDLRYAQLAVESGEFAEARARFQSLLESSRGVEPRVETPARWGLARATEGEGGFEAAAGLYQRLWEEALAEADGELAGRCAVALCRCYRETGDLSRSVEIGEVALRRLAEIGADATDGGIEVASTLVGVFYERGDLAAAASLAERTIDRAQQLDSRRARGAAYWNASVVAYERGRQHEALRLAEKALAMLAEGGDERALARLRTLYGAMQARAQPGTEEGLSQLRQARKRLEDVGDSIDLAYSDTEIAVALHLLGRNTEATQAAQASLDRLGSEQRLETARARLAMAAALAGRGQVEGAQQEMAVAAGELESAGATRQSARAWRELGDLFAVLGDGVAAQEAFDRALRMLGIGPSLPVHRTKSARLAHRG